MKKLFQFEIDTRRKWIIFTILGLHIAFAKWIGNCFSPALVFEWKGLMKKQNGKRPACLIVTWRARAAETTIYFNGSRFWWNSGHLARCFGHIVEAPHGDIHKWHNHIDM